MRVSNKGCGVPAYYIVFLFFLGLSCQLQAFTGPPYTAEPYSRQHDTIFYPSIAKAIEAGINLYRNDPNFSSCSYFVDGSTDTITVAYVGFTGTTPNGPCNVEYGNGGMYSYYSIEIWSWGGYGYKAGKNLGSACPCNGGLGGGAVNPSLVGDPINAAIGNKFEQEDDYIINPWLTFRRFYNSAPDVAPADMGPNWRHSFNRRIDILKYSNGSQIATAFRPDGQQEDFSNSSGSWTTDANNQDVLTDIVNEQGVITGYTLHVVSVNLYEKYDVQGVLQSVVDDSGQGVSLTYSTSQTPPDIAPKAGLLVGVTDPYGRQLRFAYQSNALLHQVTLPDNGTFIYSYDSYNNLISVRYPDTKIRQYTYNEPSLVNGDFPNAMTGVIDEQGGRYKNTIYISYQNSARPVLSNMALHANEVRVSYNIDGYGTGTVTYPLGFTSNIGFAEVNGGLKQPRTVNSYCGVLCDNLQASISFDANGYQKSHTDFKGTTTITDHDVHGLLVHQVEASGALNQRTIDTSWDNRFRKPLSRTLLDANGATVAITSWAYNLHGKVEARCEADPAQASAYICAPTGAPPVGVRRWTYAYCNAIDATQCPLPGLLLSVDGPRTDVSDTTTYSYYLTTDESGCGVAGGACHRAGDLYQVADALGHVTTYAAYEKNGRVVRVSDANGVNTDLAYTPRGWLASRTVGSATTTIGYTPYGAVSSVTDPDGITTTYTYDAAHRLTDITDVLGNRIHYTLDRAGNKTKEETFDPMGTVRRSLARSYNTLGQLTAVTDGLNHMVFSASYSDSYDATGNLEHTADAMGVQRLLSYDGLNRLVSTIENYNGADPTTGNTQSVFTYDARDNLEGVSDPDGLATSYDYDGLNNLSAQHSPDIGTTTYTYDAAGNRTGETDAKGIHRTYAYDALGRLASAHYPDGAQDISYRYDEGDTVTGCSGSYPVGRLTRVVENSVSTTYCYDAHGNVVRKMQTQGTQVDTTTYSYTPGDRLAAIGYPSGTQVSYVRDADGRVQSISLSPAGGSASSAVSAVTYLPFGPVVSYTLGNGQTITRSYDANYALTDVASPALNLHFARDPMGNITALGNAPGANPASETYGYDPLYRLTAVNDAAGTAIEAYTYNKTGDRLSKSGSGLATGAYAYAPGTHRLTATGTATRSYDANGNTIGRTQGGETFGFDYNDRNRLSQVQRNGSVVGSYTYNAFGQRVRKVTPADTSSYNYDEASRLVHEASAGAVRDYVWLDDLPVAVVDKASGSPGTVSYVHADGLGTPRAVTDGAGALVWQWGWQSNPFGEQAPVSSGYTMNLRFPGQYADAESGMADNINRTYEAAVGRYTQSDPIGLSGGLNTYGYVGNSPLNNTDPKGECIEDACVVEGALAYEAWSWLSGSAAAGMAMSNDNPTQGWAFVNDPVARQEYEAYKNRCSEPPPPGLNDCDKEKWKLQRNLDCRSMRQAWDSKWLPGRHDKSIKQLDMAIERNRKNIERLCRDCQK